MSERRATILERRNAAMSPCFSEGFEAIAKHHAERAGIRQPYKWTWDVYTDAWFIVEGTEPMTQDEMSELRRQDGERWMTRPETPWHGVIGNRTEEPAEN